MFLSFPDKTLDLGTPSVMGILNVTPDSFSDGGRFNHLDAALLQAEKMMADGAVIIDVGGESTRPGAALVSESEELDRVAVIVEAMAKRLDVIISLDTSTPLVMKEGVRLGAAMINDVRALERPGALKAAVECRVPVCLMHMQGSPATMQNAPEYRHALVDVKSYLAERIECAIKAGIPRECLLVDPGFGFGKTLQHNTELLKHLEEFNELGCPILVGVSRKTMLGQITGREVGQRMAASISAAAIAVYNGAHIVRAHDVGPTVDAIKIAAAIRQA